MYCVNQCWPYNVRRTRDSTVEYSVTHSVRHTYIQCYVHCLCVYFCQDHRKLQCDSGYTMKAIMTVYISTKYNATMSTVYNNKAYWHWEFRRTLDRCYLKWFFSFLLMFREFLLRMRHDAIIMLSFNRIDRQWNQIKFQLVLNSFIHNSANSSKMRIICFYSRNFDDKSIAWETTASAAAISENAPLRQPWILGIWYTSILLKSKKKKPMTRFLHKSQPKNIVSKQTVVLMG